MKLRWQTAATSIHWAVAAALVVWCGTAATARAQSGGPGAYVIDKCVIDLIDDIELPATEAGVLIELGVKEGSMVRANEVLARIDPREAQARKVAADYGLKVAIERAKDDIEERFAEAQAAASESEVQELEAANSGVAKAVPEAELRTARLNWKRSLLAIEKAQHDRELAKMEAWVKSAELDLAKIGLERRAILAPFDGRVLTLVRRKSEWVSPGDPILRIVRLDTLQVDGYVFLDEHAPGEVDGCEVTIEAAVGPDRKVSTSGRIVNVDPIAGRYSRDRLRYLVRAEIANQQEGGRWLLMAKLPATMTIHLGTGPAMKVSDKPQPTQ